MPLNHLPTGLLQHPGVNFCNQSGALGDRNKLSRRQQPPQWMFPAHQRLNTNQATGLQIVHRLVIHAQLVLLQGTAQIPGHLNTVLRMGCQLFGVQGIAFTPYAFGLEQGRVGIAQQLLGIQCVFGEYADTDTGADKQLVFIDIEGAFHDLQHLLRSIGGMGHLRAIIDQHGKLIATQSSHGKAFAKYPLQTVRDCLEQKITDVMAKAVVDDLEVVEVDHQQRTARLMALRRSQSLLGTVSKQQSIGQVSQRIVMNKSCQFALGVLDRGNV